MQHQELNADPSADLLAMTADITCAFVSNNSIAQSDLPLVINSIHESLSGVAAGEAEDEPPEPAVPIRSSVKPDHIVCLEDGRKLKMLKRHLRTKFDMSPEEYRDRWGLPADYPMTAPNYSKQRRQLAIDSGLGRKEA